MKKDKINNTKGNTGKPVLLASNKSSEERFARQLGKLGSSIFIIIVAMYFKVPDKIQNLYLMIALTMLIYQPLFRTIKVLVKKTQTTTNWIEVTFVVTSILAVSVNQYLGAAIIMAIGEIIETVRTRPM